MRAILDPRPIKQHAFRRPPPYEITDLFYLTVSLDYDYESQPAPGNEKKDTSLVLGAGFEF